MRMPAAQTLTMCSGVAFRPRVKAPRSALPSMLTTPLMAKPLLNLRRTVSRPFGSSARRTLLNVSWLGIPCLSSRNRRNNSNRPWPKNSNSVQLLAPASVAASAMITMSSRSCRVLSARGSLSGRSRRLSLRIQVSLNRKTPQNPVPTALQHLSSAICDSPTLQGRMLHSSARRVLAMTMSAELPVTLTQPDTIAASSPSRLRRYARPALGLLLPVGLAVIWEIWVGLGYSNGRLVPPPTKIFATVMELAKSGELSRHIIATVTRVAAGFGLGVAAGTILGAISGYWGLARQLLDPTVQALRAIPSIAWVPLFILWLGIFETSKIALIAVGVFFPVYLGVMGAILSVDRKIVEVGRTFRLSGPAMIRRILLPAVLPAYVVALRVGLGLGWMFVVAAEFMGASEGLGYLLIDGQQLGKPAQILAAIVIFAILGKTTDWLIEIAAAPLLRWQDAFGRQSGAT